MSLKSILFGIYIVERIKTIKNVSFEYGLSASQCPKELAFPPSLIHV